MIVARVFSGQQRSLSVRLKAIHGVSIKTCNGWTWLFPNSRTQPREKKVQAARTKTQCRRCI